MYDSEGINVGDLAGNLQDKLIYTEKGILCFIIGGKTKKIIWEAEKNTKIFKEYLKFN